MSHWMVFCILNYDTSTANGPYIQEKNALNGVLCDPRYAQYLAIVKAARNGAVYGAKVRFPHALV
jgi:hypothetical protein